MTKTAWIITCVVVALLAAATYAILQTEPPVSADDHGHGHDHGSAESGHEDHDDHAGTEESNHPEEPHGDADHQAQEGHEGHDHEHGGNRAADQLEDDHERAPEDATPASSDRAERPATGRSLGTVTLSHDVLRDNAITFITADSGYISNEIQLPGEISLNADKVAHIVPRFSGIALKVLKKLGDHVASGEVLAVVQSNESVAPYEVKSLLSGTVIERHMTLGEYVRDDGDVFVVADLSTVWVHISVYPKYLSHVRPGLRVRLKSTGDLTTEGVIDYVGPIVGERTRTAQARVVLDNSSGAWQPGLFVTAHLAMPEVPVEIAVPDEAIQTVEGQPAVFVLADGGIEVRAVEQGRSDGRWVEIRSGLRPGERVAATNTFLIKAEFGKSEAGHDH